MFDRVFISALLIALTALTACVPTTGFRDAGAPISSSVGFDPARFAGTWQEIASIGRPSGIVWQVTTAPDRSLTIATSHDGTGKARITAPGQIDASNFAAPLWVLWVDADYRTILLGTPGGDFAMILDRSATGSPDRLRAARTLLAWNGYDPEALR